MGNPKTLIVYYSRTGNTKVVAELIQEKLGGDLFQIETQEQRPSNYRKEVEKNEEEQEDSLLPELKSKISNFNQYDRIFIGTPTWNMALPQAILTFMDSYEFAGKTVIPFNTNGGYGTGSTFNQIKSSVQGAEVLDGYSVKGGEETKGTILAIEGERKVEVSREIDTWLEKIGQLNN
ncbi:flavodoxin [Listeria monocytogenes]|uniref:Flavodoxin n=2 Tax=Listeria monocytogenes TaxID=1639 RepID=A0A9Q4AF28_LISMN|nr:flavodoxin [Listeria monocytogenes]EAD5036178.1 flavodoxin [Listeria monocytogenes serotype 1/2a]EAA0253319.1 flavodoxin [Listeria monocytogenes]EAC2419059.1 flavodoxin [Listeria monocytogenes]EAC2697185.1 flavodoxin [Listeria monocytogenes]